MSFRQSDDAGKLKILRQEISALQQKLQTRKQKESEALEIIDTIDKKINLTKTFIKKLQNATAAQRKNIKGLQAQSGQLQENLRRLRANYKSRLISLYKRGRLSTIEILLEAKTLHDLQLWAQFQKRLADYDERRIIKIRIENKKLKKTQEELSTALNREELLLNESRDEEKHLTQDRAKKKSLLSRIRTDNELFEKQIRDYQDELVKIQNLIATAENQPEDTSLDLVEKIDFVGWKGKLRWPAPGEVTRNYGAYKHPVLKTVTENLGIDIAVEPGTIVVAVAAGRITAITWQRGRGNLIIVNHGAGYYTVYTHIDEILIDLKQSVEGGQAIGRVGETGSAEQAILHFQIWRKFDHLNPNDWLISQVYGNAH